MLKTDTFTWMRVYCWQGVSNRGHAQDKVQVLPHARHEERSAVVARFDYTRLTILYADCETFS